MSITEDTNPTLLVEKKEDYAIVVLNQGKVNAINTNLLTDLKIVFQSLSADERVKGVILSGRPHVFSAGLDIMHIATLGAEGGKAFWIHYMEVMKELVEFPKPLVCAITGYAPAGATILTLCTDYRIMGRGPKHVIGMHEFKMNMQIPELLSDVYAYHLGEVNSWKAVQKAQLFNSDEALEVGLVDESVEVENVLERSEEYLQKLTKIYPKVYHQSKKYFKRKLHRIVSEADFPKLAQETIDFNSDPQLQAKVLEFMMQLKNKK